VIGGWRKLLNEELHNLYSSSNKIRMKSRKMIRAGRVARMGKEKNGCRILMGKPGGKELIRIPRRRWEDNIQMVVRDWMRCYRLDSSGSRYGLVEDSCEYGNEPRSSIRFGEFLSSRGTGSLSRRARLYVIS
jgi:hypothetical protein